MAPNDFNYYAANEFDANTFLPPFYNGRKVLASFSLAA
jgi:hypothetical protein